MQNRQINEWNDFWSKKQNKLFHMLKVSLTKQIVRFIKSKRKKGKILDAGCGESLTSKYLKNQFYTVGLDYSSIACNLAKKNVHEIIQGDIFNIPYKKPEFDIVFNQGVVQTVKNPLTLIKEMLRVTKENG